MPKIYIVVSFTGTILSRIVKLYTRKKYAHVSISLDEDLEEMYSFGRLNPYNPFIGGFVHEGIDHGTFKRFYKTEAKIYSLEISQKKYYELKKIIKNIQKHKNNYSFNVIGLFAIVFNMKITKENSFYCAEFVKYVLEHSDIIELPDIIKPDDFEKIPNTKEIYKGQLRKYKRA